MYTRANTCTMQETDVGGGQMAKSGQNPQKMGLLCVVRTQKSLIPSNQTF